MSVRKDPAMTQTLSHVHYGRYFDKEEHGHNLKSGVDLANCLELIPFVGYKIGPPDADWGRVCFGLSSTC